MAPPPEYDKEPKAPDKSVPNFSSEDIKSLQQGVDHQTSLDYKSATATSSVEVENNKNVEHLDDGQLKALLDEAITYKRPKDREGKSSLFNELLEEVEQDEQALEAAARELSGGRCGRGRGGGARARRPLPHSNSLQNLEQEARAAETALRRVRHAPSPAVSARATHGGSLPSDVDKSFLVGDEGGGGGGGCGAGYLATVRCVNPPPLHQRRVSASDAHCPAEIELLNRRSKPPFPMTYTARATLEIGSSSVCSGRAVTTTTASNQVRTPRRPAAAPPPTPSRHTQPPHRLRTNKQTPPSHRNDRNTLRCDAVRSQNENLQMRTEIKNPKQVKLLNALRPKHRAQRESDDLYRQPESREQRKDIPFKILKKHSKPISTHDDKPRGPRNYSTKEIRRLQELSIGTSEITKEVSDVSPHTWSEKINYWYEEFDKNSSLYAPRQFRTSHNDINNSVAKSTTNNNNIQNSFYNAYSLNAPLKSINHMKFSSKNTEQLTSPYESGKKNNCFHHINCSENKQYYNTMQLRRRRLCDKEPNEPELVTREKFEERVGFKLARPFVFNINPRNVRSMTIAEPLSQENTNLVLNKNDKIIDLTAEHNTFSTKSIDLLQPSSKVCKQKNERSVSSSKKDEIKVNQNEAKLDDIIECKETHTEGFDLAKKDTEYITMPQDRTFTLENSKDCEIDYKSQIVEQTANESYAIFNSYSLDESRVNENVTELIDMSTERNIGVKDNEKEIEIELVDFSKNQKFDPRKNQSLKDYFSGQLQLLNTLRRNDDDSHSVKSNGRLTCDTTKVDDFIKENKLVTILEDSLREDTNCDNTKVDDFLKKNKPVTMIEDSKKNDTNFDATKVDYFIKENQPVTIIEDSVKEDESCDITYVDKFTKENKPVTVIEDSVKEYNSCLFTTFADETVPTQNESSREVAISTSVKHSNITPYVLAELPDNAYVFLTFLNSLPSSLNNELHLNSVVPYTSEENNIKTKKKADKFEANKKKDRVSKNSLRAILLKNLTKSDIDGQTKSLNKEVTPAIDSKEVDSAIPFNCITTSEVVDSCNTTSSSTHSGLAEDTKSRSAISSTYNGLQLARTNYGSTSSSAPEEYKKSLDENGNAVQGYSSPHSGSSQHKKPRRKKSSKNETVITSHQIDGYKGDKDLNEVLRFIESNAEQSRGHKLGRAKHKDDADDKGKKRSAERRKEKDKPKRASSLEELSRTKLEDLTDKPPADRWVDDAPKPERRSWGDDARESFYYCDDAVPDAPPDADFQTVTKKRKPRRRADEQERESGGGEAPRARPPEARARRVSAPPSDRSNDSNDDMDSVHSLPSMPALAAVPAPAPPPPISYADIARTRHNIPDLIESCNFYAEGEPAAGESRRAVEQPPAAAVDADYPALEPRALATRRHTRDPSAKPAPQHTPRTRDRKERTPEVPRPVECPAPDVVADRRPPVILLDSTTRPRDMDGVTFGFDINEQLLGGGVRRGRCDLVRDAVAGAGVTVAAGCAALTYLPPLPPPDTQHLLQIVDYVGAAWDDVVRCGNGKVRYFSE